MSDLDFEAIADAAEAVVFAGHHKDLCGCDRWPDSCPHFPKDRTLFSVNAYDVVVAAAPLIERALRERIAYQMTACTKCGKPHVYRDLPPTGQYVRGTWADPADGHSYYPRINNGTLASESISIVFGEVTS